MPATTVVAEFTRVAYSSVSNMALNVHEYVYAKRVCELHSSTVSKSPYI